jgi:subtilisin family serine protease
MAVRVLDATGSGTTATVAQGLRFAVQNGARVVNLSLGGGGGPDPLFQDAIALAERADVVVVVAAGNDGEDNDGGSATYPCNFTNANLVCVAALDQAYRLAGFSNYGALSVDVGAPGTNIVSAWPGASAVTTDPLTSGWTRTSTTSAAGGGWAYSTLSLTSGPVHALTDPATYPDGAYRPSTDDRIYRNFPLTGVDAAVLQVLAAVDVAEGDHLAVACDPGGLDPFASPGALVLLDATDVATFPSLEPLAFDVSACAGPSSTLGLQLRSGVDGGGRGVAIAELELDTLTLGTSGYDTLSGTSMAAPEVAGLAAMLRTFHPRYSAVDVVEAIGRGGRAVPDLAGRTTTGRAIDVMGSLAYVRPPTGVTAEVR